MPGKRPKNWIRMVSACVAVCFFVTEHSLPKAFALPVATSVEISVPPKNFPSNLKEIRVPENIGKVEEVFQGDGRLVILVQDAHAIPDAQRNIRNLIDFFQQQYGLDTVAVEGSITRMNPQIFRSFPDRELLRKIFGEYLDNGELTGTAMAAIFNRSEAVYQGIEDWDLYEEGYGFYLESLSRQPVIKTRLESIREELNSQKESVYSPALLKTDQALQSFLHGKMDLIKVLETLAVSKAPPKGSELALILEENSRTETSRIPVELEVKSIAEKVRDYFNRAGNPGRRESILEFNEKYQAFQTSRITAEAFALFLRDLCREMNLPFRFSSDLHSRVKKQRKLQDIEGTRFFDDFERYAKSVKADLISEEHELRLDQESQRLYLLERLSRLELTRDQWNELKSYARGSFENFNGGPLEGKDLQRLIPENDLREKLIPHLLFYENAESRDQVFVTKLLELKKERGRVRTALDRKAVLLVAGGFHTEGLVARLKAEGASYLLLTPQINALPGQISYQDHMRGIVSWKDYYEIEQGTINIYKAFVRYTRDRLVEAAQKSDPLQSAFRAVNILKEWRDQIIRDLAEKGRVGEAGSYTRFIDEVSEPSGGSFSQEELTKKIDLFMKGLRELEASGSLNEQNILKLVQPAAVLDKATGLVLSSETVTRFSVSDAVYRKIDEAFQFPAVSGEALRPDSGTAETLSADSRAELRAAVKQPKPSFPKAEEIQSDEFLSRNTFGEVSFDEDLLKRLGTKFADKELIRKLLTNRAFIENQLREIYGVEVAPEENISIQIDGGTWRARAGESKLFSQFQVVAGGKVYPMGMLDGVFEENEVEEKHYLHQAGLGPAVGSYVDRTILMIRPVQGQTLNDLSAESPEAWESASRQWMDLVLNAYLKGVFMVDPSFKNIMVEEGRPVVVDAGTLYLANRDLLAKYLVQHIVFAGVLPESSDFYLEKLSDIFVQTVSQILLSENPAPFFEQVLKEIEVLKKNRLRENMAAAIARSELRSEEESQSENLPSVPPVFNTLVSQLNKIDENTASFANAFKTFITISSLPGSSFSSSAAIQRMMVLVTALQERKGISSKALKEQRIKEALEGVNEVLKPQGYILGYAEDFKNEPLHLVNFAALRKQAEEVAAALTLRRPGPIKKILVAEDILVKEYQKWGQELFSKSGIQVTVKENGKEGLEELLAHHEDYDLIISDVNMPEMYGPEMMNAFSEQVPEKSHAVPAIYVTDVYLGNLKETRSIPQPFPPVTNWENRSHIEKPAAFFDLYTLVTLTEVVNILNARFELRAGAADIVLAQEAYEKKLKSDPQGAAQEYSDRVNEIITEYLRGKGLSDKVVAYVAGSFSMRSASSRSDLDIFFLIDDSLSERKQEIWKEFEAEFKDAILLDTGIMPQIRDVPVLTTSDLKTYLEGLRSQPDSRARPYNISSLLFLSATDPKQANHALSVELRNQLDQFYADPVLRGRIVDFDFTKFQERDRVDDSVEIRDAEDFIRRAKGDATQRTRFGTANIRSLMTLMRLLELNQSPRDTSVLFPLEPVTQRLWFERFRALIVAGEPVIETPHLESLLSANILTLQSRSGLLDQKDLKTVQGSMQAIQNITQRVLTAMEKSGTVEIFGGKTKLTEAERAAHERLAAFADVGRSGVKIRDALRDLKSLLEKASSGETGLPSALQGQSAALIREYQQNKYLGPSLGNVVQSLSYYQDRFMGKIVSARKDRRFLSESEINDFLEEKIREYQKDIQPYLEAVKSFFEKYPALRESEFQSADASLTHDLKSLYDDFTAKTEAAQASISLLPKAPGISPPSGETFFDGKTVREVLQESKKNLTNFPAILGFSAALAAAFFFVPVAGFLLTALFVVMVPVHEYGHYFFAKRFYDARYGKEGTDQEVEDNRPGLALIGRWVLGIVPQPSIVFEEKMYSNREQAWISLGGFAAELTVGAVALTALLVFQPAGWLAGLLAAIIQIAFIVVPIRAIAEYRSVNGDTYKFFAARRGELQSVDSVQKEDTPLSGTETAESARDETEGRSELRDKSDFENLIRTAASQAEAILREPFSDRTTKDLEDLAEKIERAPYVPGLEKNYVIALQRTAALIEKQIQSSRETDARVSGQLSEKLINLRYAVLNRSYRILAQLNSSSAAERRTGRQYFRELSELVPDSFGKPLSQKDRILARLQTTPKSFLVLEEGTGVTLVEKTNVFLRGSLWFVDGLVSLLFGMLKTTLANLIMLMPFRILGLRQWAVNNVEEPLQFGQGEVLRMGEAAPILTMFEDVPEEERVKDALRFSFATVLPNHLDAMALSKDRKITSDSIAVHEAEHQKYQIELNEFLQAEDVTDAAAVSRFALQDIANEIVARAAEEIRLGNENAIPWEEMKTWLSGSYTENYYAVIFKYFQQVNIPKSEWPAVFRSQENFNELSNQIVDAARFLYEDASIRNLLNANGKTFRFIFVEGLNRGWDAEELIKLKNQNELLDEVRGFFPAGSEGSSALLPDSRSELRSESVDLESFLNSGAGQTLEDHFKGYWQLLKDWRGNASEIQESYSNYPETVISVLEVFGISLPEWNAEGAAAALSDALKDRSTAIASILDYIKKESFETRDEEIIDRHRTALLEHLSAFLERVETLPVFPEKMEGLTTPTPQVTGIASASRGDAHLVQANQAALEGRLQEARDHYFSALSMSGYGVEAVRRAVGEAFFQTVEARYRELENMFPDLDKRTKGITWQERLVPLHQPMIQNLIERRKEAGIGLEAPLVVMDVGIGKASAPTTFRLLELLSEAGFTNVRVIGIDNQESYVDNARAKAASLGLESAIQFELVSDFDLSQVSTGLFNAQNEGLAELIFISNVLLYYKGQEQTVIDKLRQGLAPSGLLVASEGPAEMTPGIDYAVYPKTGEAIVKKAFIDAPDRSGRTQADRFKTQDPQSDDRAELRSDDAAPAPDDSFRSLEVGKTEKIPYRGPIEIKLSAEETVSIFEFEDLPSGEARQEIYAAGFSMEESYYLLYTNPRENKTYWRQLPEPQEEPRMITRVKANVPRWNFPADIADNHVQLKVGAQEDTAVIEITAGAAGVAVRAEDSARNESMILASLSVDSEGPVASRMNEFARLFRQWQASETTADSLRYRAMSRSLLGYLNELEFLSTQVSPSFNLDSELSLRLGADLNLAAVRSQLQNKIQQNEGRPELRSQEEDQDPFLAKFTPPEGEISTLSLPAGVVDAMLPQMPLVFEAMAEEDIQVRAFGGAVRGLAFATQFQYTLPISEFDLAVPGETIYGDKFEALMRAQESFKEKVLRKERTRQTPLEALEIHPTPEPDFSYILKNSKEWSISKFWLEYDAASNTYQLKGLLSSVEDLKARRLRLSAGEFLDPQRVLKLLDQAFEYLRFGFTLEESELKAFEDHLAKEDIYGAQSHNANVRTEAGQKIAEVRKEIQRLSDIDSKQGAPSSSVQELLDFAFASPGPAERERLSDLHRNYLNESPHFSEDEFIYVGEGPHFITYFHHSGDAVIKAPIRSKTFPVHYEHLVRGTQIGQRIFAAYGLVSHGEIERQGISIPEDLDQDTQNLWVVQQLAFSIKEHLLALKDKRDAALAGNNQEEAGRIENDLKLLVQEWRRLMYRAWAMGIVLGDYTFENTGVTSTGRIRQTGVSFDESWDHFFKGSTSMAILANNANQKWLTETFGKELAETIYGEGLNQYDFDLLWPAGERLTGSAAAEDRRAPFFENEEALNNALEGFWKSIRDNTRSELREETETDAAARILEDAGFDAVDQELLKTASGLIQEFGLDRAYQAFAVFQNSNYNRQENGLPLLKPSQKTFRELAEALKEGTSDRQFYRMIFLLDNQAVQEDGELKSPVPANAQEDLDFLFDVLDNENVARVIKIADNGQSSLTSDAKRIFRAVSKTADEYNYTLGLEEDHFQKRIARLLETSTVLVNEEGAVRVTYRFPEGGVISFEYRENENQRLEGTFRGADKQGLIQIMENNRRDSSFSGSFLLAILEGSEGQEDRVLEDLTEIARERKKSSEISAMSNLALRLFNKSSEAVSEKHAAFLVRVLAADSAVSGSEYIFLRAFKTAIKNPQSFRNFLEALKGLENSFFADHLLSQALWEPQTQDIYSSVLAFFEPQLNGDERAALKEFFPEATVSAKAVFLHLLKQDKAFLEEVFQNEKENAYIRVLARLFLGESRPLSLADAENLLNQPGLEKQFNPQFLINGDIAALARELEVPMNLILTVYALQTTVEGSRILKLTPEQYEFILSKVVPLAGIEFPRDEKLELINASSDFRITYGHLKNLPNRVNQMTLFHEYMHNALGRIGIGMPKAVGQVTEDDGTLREFNAYNSFSHALHELMSDLFAYASPYDFQEGLREWDESLLSEEQSEAVGDADDLLEGHLLARRVLRQFRKEYGESVLWKELTQFIFDELREVAASEGLTPAEDLMSDADDQKIFKVLKDRAGIPDTADEKTAREQTLRNILDRALARIRQGERPELRSEQSDQVKFAAVVFYLQMARMANVGEGVLREAAGVVESSGAAAIEQTFRRIAENQNLESLLQEATRTVLDDWKSEIRKNIEAISAELKGIHGSAYADERLSSGLIIPKGFNPGLSAAAAERLKAYGVDEIILSGEQVEVSPFRQLFNVFRNVSASFFTRPSVVYENLAVAALGEIDFTAFHQGYYPLSVEGLEAVQDTQKRDFFAGELVPDLTGLLARILKANSRAERSEIEASLIRALGLVREEKLISGSKPNIFILNAAALDLELQWRVIRLVAASA